MKKMTKLLTVFLLATALALGQTSQTTATIFTSGQGVQAVNTNNSTSGTFAYVIAGAPTTISITVSGCLYATGGCDLLDIYTSVANITRTPTISNTYNYFLIAATWTGGTAPSVTVTTTLTGGSGPAPVTGQPVQGFTSTGAPTTACASNQVNTDKSSGDFYNCKNSVWNKVNASAGAVSSVFTRTGAVAAANGDYSVGQVTGAAPLASPALTGTPAAPTAASGTNTTQLATTAFVATAVQGVNPAVAVQAATTQASDTSGLTYTHVAGIGDFFTGTANTAITIDGFTFTALNQRLLVKNDTQSPSGAFNGIYYVTTLQALGVPPVLTRALDFDTPSDMNNTGAIPVINGTANASTQWVISSTVNTVGTDPATFAQFSANPANNVTQTSNASSGQICTYTGANKVCVPATALPNGVTATTQSANDNSTKVATTAYVDAKAGPTYSTASTPAAPTLVTSGSAGSTSITYSVVGCQDTACTLHTAASATTTIGTANATLSASNFVKVSAYLVHLDGAQCYQIRRESTNGTSPTTTGVIATCVGQEYSDQGAAGDSSTAPVTNTTILVSNPFPLPGCAIAVGGYVNALAPPCSPKELDDEFNETSITLDPRWSWTNQNSASVTQSNGVLQMTSPSRGAHSLNCYLQTAPSTPYTFEISLSHSAGGTTVNLQGGAAFYESATNKAETWGILNTSGGDSLQFAQWTSASSNPPTQSLSASGVTFVSFPTLFKIQADGTNLIFSHSGDGITFIQDRSEAKASFFTTTPNQVGICIDNHDGANFYSIDFWRRTQ